VIEVTANTIDVQIVLVGKRSPDLKREWVKREWGAFVGVLGDVTRGGAGQPWLASQLSYHDM
jgi:hypothetical protein